jgi:hypothetical protein
VSANCETNFELGTLVCCPINSLNNLCIAYVAYTVILSEVEDSTRSDFRVFAALFFTFQPNRFAAILRSAQDGSLEVADLITYSGSISFCGSMTTVAPAARRILTSCSVSRVIKCRLPSLRFFD